MRNKDKTLRGNGDVSTVKERGYREMNLPLCYHLTVWCINQSLSALLSLAGISGRKSFTWVRLQQPQEQRYPFLSVCAVFVCVPALLWLLVL